MEDRFLLELEQIPWFANLGKPLAQSSGVRRIAGWDDWPGPEDEGVTEIHLRHQSLYDGLLESAKEKRGLAEHLWRNIHEVVIRLASRKVPYDPNKDTWHAPS